MNKEQLVTQISRKTRIPKYRVQEIFSTALDVIAKTVAKRRTVRINGFGTFHAARRKTQSRYNPHTGQMYTVPEKRVPAFRSHPQFNQRVQKTPNLIADATPDA